ncbi:MAG: hypothetical protein ACOZNI_24755 [Myxococcota bacterium]
MTWLALLLAARPRTVSLEFAWPAGLDVPVSSVTVVRTEPPTAERVIEDRWRVRTEAVPGGLRVWSTEPDGQRVIGEPLVVDAAGGIVQAPEGGAREAWNRLVGSWAGADFAAGEPHEWTDLRALPSLGMVTARVTSRATWEGRVPCPGQRRARCAALSLVISPSPDQVVKAVRWQLAEARRTDPVFPEGFEIAAATLTESVRLVVDPATLLPWQEIHASEHYTEATNGAKARTWSTTTVTWARSPS